ncbi:ABC transporter ATP-binding protein [Cellulomonas chengniuliangii]|uniref:Sn-glycerol-3-phosphate ABC transporter ATP-binding protein UgpC n=1 Tax=Cellulomonas chengniuliangii TaxID=2968084 RepID=A0ABY5L027_9CELL|nr:sn-glycerol-3-phosphate ABC transporter ATP-binding protein UgpC [Cellulomonas chengniuliangii]MCC2307068.1 sn-glycerol-3-phosphate ABC transporter ATP-binding protein UgpC [Cellulomonas chengniuliangii]MCC2316451.1 sn-glycerol-3-phosphate ABC transporter ATP-binding protein UgpC [Cellulomonas chengniuliangii]UUI76130.1 sn-glycerol-3-phosphate ABC transporter ATP-binding protein UgpC [Cellulomonas chengniuliangii]
MASISLKDIVKVYGDGYLAVKGVSLDIAEGEFVILVGPSGCGKSTLLRMIVGLEDITSGDLLIDGERVNEEAPRKRRLAMVFQNYALYPHLTVFENIAFPLRLEKGQFTEEQIREKVRFAAETLELQDHLDRKPANLSGGQRQRVAMGRAIVRDARAFLFDEPLSNLDAKLRGQMRTEISRLQRSLGTTTVYVTHDQTEAMTLGDRVAVLRKGELQQIASPRGLYEQPVNLFVAGFIGSPPMNFLPGEVVGDVLRLPIADVPLTPSLRERLGDRELVIVGIRPDHFADAALLEDHKRGAGVTFDAAVDVVEWLGSEQYAYIPFDTHPDVASKLDELDRDLDGESMRTQLVAALSSESKVRDGDTHQLWFDPARMLVFDPESWTNLTYDEDAARVLDEQNEQDRRAALDRAAARLAAAST